MPPNFSLEPTRAARRVFTACRKYDCSSASAGRSPQRVRLSSALDGRSAYDCF
jgi:hypothetical protein